MPDPTTTNLAIPYPTGTDLISAGPAEMQAIATTIDAIIPAGNGDVLQPGVVAATDGTVSNPAVSGAGVVSATATLGGFAWGLLGGTALVRNSIPTGAISATPGSLPASSKFAIVGIDLVIGQFGAAGSIALSTKGTDQTTAALALSNSPATASGHLRLMDVIIENNAGTYRLPVSGPQTRDRRPWARGAFFRTLLNQSPAIVATSTMAPISAASLSQRVECTGRPMKMRLAAQLFNQGTSTIRTLSFQPWVDGATADAFTATAMAFPMQTVAITQNAISLEWVTQPAAGSRLFQWAFAADSVATATSISGTVEIVVQEVPAVNAGNGTS